MLYGFGYSIKKMCYLKDKLDRVSDKLTYGFYKSPQFDSAGGRGSHSNKDVLLELLTLEESLISDIEFEQKKMDKTIELLKCLDTNEFELICMRYDLNMEQKRIAQYTGYTREGARDRLTSIIDKIVKSM